MSSLAVFRTRDGTSAWPVLLEEAEERPAVVASLQQEEGKNRRAHLRTNPDIFSPVATLPGVSGFPVLQFVGADSSQ